jgi:Trk K+ transport system NAD-binding subunit
VSSVFFIALRRLRAPLILIIVIYAASIVGLTLIPGVDDAGRPWHPTIFQAFYFVSYTATTIGFGEIPYAFTDRQRLWVTFIVYLSVFGWAYLLSALLRLSQDQGFQQAILTARFRQGVQTMREPFYLVCGLGETGLMVIQSLRRRDIRFVVIDADWTRLHELELQEHVADALALATDARSPDALVMAGLLKSECQGVLALSSDDDVNLAVALAVHLLHPGIPVLCRSHSPAMTLKMQTVTNCTVIDPFQEFAEQLLLAMRAPDSHRLIVWLTAPPGTYLRPSLPAPPGAWVVCGYGRFGTRLVAVIESGGFKVTIVDPAGEERPGCKVVRGHGTDHATLFDAGIATAAGLVAGTDSDTANLAIAITARRLNPGLFVIARQNHVSNQPLFAALAADMTMVSSQIIANECVAELRIPLLAKLVELVRTNDNDWAERVVERLKRIVGDRTPDFWSLDVTAGETPGLVDVLTKARRHRLVTIGDLLRRPVDREQRNEIVPLLLLRGDEVIDLPADDLAVELGDSILFAGTLAAEDEQWDLVRNANIAAYVLTGEGALGGYVWQWFADRRAIPRNG